MGYRPSVSDLSPQSPDHSSEAWTVQLLFSQREIRNDLPPADQDELDGFKVQDTSFDF